MKISSTMVGIIIFSGLMAGMTSVIIDLGSNYQKTDTFDSDAFDKTAEINERVENITSKIQNPTGFLPADFFDILNFLFFGIASIFTTIPTIIDSIVTAISSELGIFIPSWLIVILAVVPIILIIMAILSIVTKREI